MRLPAYDHAQWLCTWHATQPQGPPIGADPKWAQKWLDEQVASGSLTAAEANEIRKQCGWPAMAQQLALFDTAAG